MSDYGERYMDDEHVPSRLEWAEEHGYDPHDETLYGPPRKQTPEERAAFESSDLGQALARSIATVRGLQQRDRSAQFTHGQAVENRETRA